MILKELFNAFTEELGAQRLTPGEPGRPVKGLAVDEEADGWLAPDEVAVTSRKTLGIQFLATVAQEGAPAVVWRTQSKPSAEALRHAEELGLGLLAVPPDIPLREMLSLFAKNGEGSGLLRYSHEAARALIESAGGEDSISKLADKLSGLLGRCVVVEDPVGRLLAGGDPAKDRSGTQALISTLETHGLRASRGSGVEETRRDRRDRYARLPNGFLSVPVERWRVADTELFWTPIGAGAPAGYLWIDLAGRIFRPGGGGSLYWASR